MKYAQTAHNALMTGHIAPGTMYMNLMAFITNDVCTDDKLRLLVHDGCVPSILDYAKSIGEYQE